MPERQASTSANRGVTPTVGKALEIAIVVLFIGMLTTALYGGIVPDYQTAAATKLSERVVVQATERIEGAIPPNVTNAHHRVRVDLPATIRGEGYWIVVNQTTLVLDHPSDVISGRMALTLPSSVVSVSGRWSSYEPSSVTVQGRNDGLHVRLQEGR